jgi:hypothetical protein
LAAIFQIIFNKSLVKYQFFFYFQFKRSIQRKYNEEIRRAKQDIQEETTSLQNELSSFKDKSNEQESIHKQELQQIKSEQLEYKKKAESDAFNHFYNLHQQHKQHFETEYQKVCNEKERILREMVNK